MFIGAYVGTELERVGGTGRHVLVDDEGVKVVDDILESERGGEEQE